MFIPIWMIHIIVTLIFIGGLIWAIKDAWEAIYKIPFVIILYLIYWLIMK